ncbi:MAG: SlyX family protein [Mariprofundaceae bacterium]|nr:SlyX family protein [Mariprofundaceae bacterium]
MNNTNKRLDELESRFSHQDHLIEELNGVIIAQQQQLDQQANELTQLRWLLRHGETPIRHQAEEAPPPHY